MQQETTDSIIVLIRIRPFNEREKQEEPRTCFRIDEHAKNTIIFDSTSKSETRYFTFDHVCPEQVSQEEIFRLIGIPTATSCLQGYNGCIFAYGQTGAGKTFTIQGQGLDVSMSQTAPIEEKEKRGLLPRVIEYMFSDIESAHDTSSSISYSVKCTFLEIYNEHIIDLLNPSAKSLQIREDLKKGVYVEGLTEETTRNAMEAFEIVKRGNRSRHIGSTNMNIESSRSHSVFTFTIEAKALKGGVTNVRKSRFSFVDLAGSERQKMVGTVGDRLKEGCLINKSLMVLANVINSLVDISEGRSRFVHYRDSKLTFLLKDSIGGNSKTSIIANISPASSSHGETLSTLKFAQRAKLIKNQAHINEDTTGSLDGLKNEIFRLRQELANMRNLINIGGIRYSDEKRDISKFSFELAPIPGGDTTGDDFLLWNPDEHETKENPKGQELEVLLKQSLDILTESETHLLGELSKKDDLIEKLTSAGEAATKNELQMKMIIRLLADKTERYKGLLKKQILTKEDCLQIIDEDQKDDWTEKVLHALRDSSSEMFTDNYQEMSELREENSRLKEHLMELLENKGRQQTENGERHMDVESRINETNQSIDERLKSRELESLREEYEKLIGDFEGLVYEMEEKNREVMGLKEALEKHEQEKKRISEEIETFSKQMEEKFRVEYDMKLEAYVAEQEIVLNQFKYDFERIKEERDLAQNNLLNVGEQLRGMEEKCRELMSENEKLIGSLGEHQEHIARLDQESLSKSAVFAKEEGIRREEIEKLANEISQFQEEMQAIAQENVAVKLENENLRNEYQTLKVLYDEKNKECEEVRRTYTTMEELCFSKQKEFEELEGLCGKLQEEFAVKQEEVGLIQRERDDLQARLSQRETERVTIQKEIENMNEMYVQLQNEFSNKERTILNLSTECETLKTNLSIKEQEWGGLKEELEKVQRERDERNQEIESGKDDFRRLQEKFVEKKKELHVVEEERDYMQRANGELSRQLEATKNELQTLKFEYDNRCRDASEARAESQSLQQRNWEQTQQIEAVQRNYDSLEKLSAQREKELETLNIEIEKARSALVDKDNEIVRINQRLEDTNQQYIIKQKEMEGRASEHNLLVQQFNVKTSEIEALRSNYETLEKEVLIKAEQINALNEETKTWEKDVVAKVEEMERQRQKYQQLFQEFEDRGRKIEQISEEYEKLQARYLAKEKVLNELNARYEAQRQEFEMWRKSETEVSRDLAVKSDELNQLKTRIFNLECELSESKDKISQQQQELENYKKAEEALISERNMFEETGKKLTEEVGQLSEKLENLKLEKEQESFQLTSKISKVQQDYSNLYQVLVKTQNEVSGLQKANSDLAQEKEKLITQLGEKTEMLEASNQKIEGLNKREESLKTSMQELENCNSDLSKELMGLKDRIFTGEGQLEKLYQDYEAVRKEKEDIQNKLRNYDVTRIEWEEEKQNLSRLEKINRENERRLQEVNEQQRQSRREFENMRIELAARDREVEKFRTENERLMYERNHLLNEVNEYKSLEARLREEIQSYSEKISSIYGEQEREINEVKEQYLKLTYDHKMLMRTIALKDDQLEKIRDECKVVFTDRARLQEEVETLKDLERKLRQENQEAFEKISRLNSDQYLLLKEIDNLNKANDTLAGHNNMGQKIKYLNKLKEENNKLKNEKIKACDDLTKALEQRDKLQRKLDELLMFKEDLDPRSSQATQKGNSSFRFEIERNSMDSQQNAPDGLARINSLIHSNLSKEDSKFIVHTKSNDIESVLNGVQALTMLLMEKNKIIHNRETELESVALKNSILEKEILVLKQKMYTINSNSVSVNNSMIITDVSNVRKTQHSPSPLETRSKNRAPTPNKNQGSTDSFQKLIEQKLGNIVHNRSNSMKKPNAGKFGDENFAGHTSFDTQLKAKYTPLRKNLLK